MTINYTADWAPSPNTGVTTSVTKVRSAECTITSSGTPNAPLLVASSVDVIMRTRCGLPWNDPVLSDVQVLFDTVSVHMLYQHTNVFSDLINDWGRVVTPTQASPWLDDAVAKALAGEQFFIQSQTNYGFVFKVRRPADIAPPISCATQCDLP